MTKTFGTLVTAKLATLMVGNAYDSDKIGASCRSIAGRGATLDVDIHATAVAAIAVSVDHGDTGCAERLTNAMPKGSRVKTLVQWFAHHSNIALTFDKASASYKAKMVKKDHADYKKVINLVKAEANPFWVVPEITKPGAFDDIMFAAAVAQLIKRASNENALLSEAGKAALADLRVVAVKVTPVTADA